MTHELLAAAVVAMTVVGLSGQERAPVPFGPDVSGRWTRQSSGTPGGGAAGSGWGPSVSIDQSGQTMTISGPGITPASYSINGNDSSVTVTNAPCRHETKTTKATATSRTITITTWRSVNTNCWHGETGAFAPSDPESEAAPQPGVSAPVGGPSGTGIGTATKRVESVTTITLSGDTLKVDQVSASLVGSTQTTSTTYHR